MTAANPALSIGTSPRAWIAILVFVSVALSLGSACAMPFAALAAIAVLTLRRRDSLLLVGSAWLANQVVGFGVLHYPWTADALGWGLVLLAVSGLTTLGAEACKGRLEDLPKMGVALVAFLSAFGIYEGLLCLVSAALGSGSEALSPNVVAEIFLLNTAAFVGLVVASRLRLPYVRSVPVEARPVG